MKYETGGSWEEVAVDLWFPTDVTVTGNPPGLPYDEFDLRATLSLALDELRYRCSSLSLRAVDAGFSAPDIDAAMLRSLSMARIMDGVSGQLGKTADQLSDGDHVIARLQIRARDEDTGLDERLATVSRIYAREVLSGRKPAQAVREELKAPSSTVGYWVRRAKDLGYIRQARPRPSLRQLLEESESDSSGRRPHRTILPERSGPQSGKANEPQQSRSDESSET